MSAKVHRILLVDDHPLLREGLAQLMGREPDLEVCGQAEDVTGALKAIEELAPDLVTVDISLPGPSGMTLLKDIQARYPTLPVLVISMHDESLYAERALRAGARGYLNKQEASRKAIAAVRRILEGELYLNERVATRMVSKLMGGEVDPSATPLDQLSDRELEVYQLVGRGLGPSQIASELHLSVKTIQSHKANIRQKLGLENARELALHAARWVQEGTVPKP